jgi:hypothetical protein
MIGAAGRLLGLREDDELDVYAPNTKTFAGSAAIARVRLETVGDFESTGRLVSGAQPPAHSRATIAAVTPPGFRLAVFVDDTNAALGAQIEMQLASHARVELARERDAAELVVGFPDDAVVITAPGTSCPESRPGGRTPRSKSRTALRCGYAGTGFSRSTILSRTSTSTFPSGAAALTRPMRRRRRSPRERSSRWK